MTIGAKPGRGTYGKGAKKRSIANPCEQKSPQLPENKGREPNSIANFSAWAAPAAKNFLALRGPRITSHESRFPAFLTGTRLQTGFPVTLSKQTTVVLSNRYKKPPPGEGDIAVTVNGAEGLLAIAPTLFYSSHPESRIPAKLRKTNGLIFSTRHTYPLDASGHHACSVLTSTLFPESA
jgi:hypothetical protein